jgi:hypothetical protein
LKEALCYLTVRLGIYLNLDIDKAYIELSKGSGSSEEEVMVIQEMGSTGELGVFRGIAMN